MINCTFPLKSSELQKRGEIERKGELEFDSRHSNLFKFDQVVK